MRTEQSSSPECRSQKRSRKDRENSTVISFFERWHQLQPDKNATSPDLLSRAVSIDPRIFPHFGHGLNTIRRIVDCVDSSARVPKVLSHDATRPHRAVRHTWKQS